MSSNTQQRRLNFVCIRKISNNYLISFCTMVAILLIMMAAASVVICDPIKETCTETTGSYGETIRTCRKVGTVSKYGGISKTYVNSTHTTITGPGRAIYRHVSDDSIKVNTQESKPTEKFPETTIETFENPIKPGMQTLQAELSKVDKNIENIRKSSDTLLRNINKALNEYGRAEHRPDSSEFDNSDTYHMKSPPQPHQGFETENTQRNQGYDQDTDSQFLGSKSQNKYDRARNRPVSRGFEGSTMYNIDSPAQTEQRLGTPNYPTNYENHQPQGNGGFRQLKNSQSRSTIPSQPQNRYENAENQPVSREFRGSNTYDNNANYDAPQPDQRFGAGNSPISSNNFQTQKNHGMYQPAKTQSPGILLSKPRKNSGTTARPYTNPRDEDDSRVIDGGLTVNNDGIYFVPANSNSKIPTIDIYTDQE